MYPILWLLLCETRGDYWICPIIVSLDRARIEMTRTRNWTSQVLFKLKLVFKLFKFCHCQISIGQAPLVPITPHPECITEQEGDVIQVTNVDGDPIFIVRREFRELRDGKSFCFVPRNYLQLPRWTGRKCVSHGHHHRRTFTRKIPSHIHVELQ